MTEEVVNNLAFEAQEVVLTCNWCMGLFKYREEPGQYAYHTTCPWCQERLSVPRKKLRRATSNAAGVNY